MDQHCQPFQVACDNPRSCSPANPFIWFGCCSPRQEGGRPSSCTPRIPMRRRLLRRRGRREPQKARSRAHAIQIDLEKRHGVFWMGVAVYRALGWWPSRASMVSFPNGGNEISKFLGNDEKRLSALRPKNFNFSRGNTSILPCGTRTNRIKS